jgi:VIT1/CCC1 family predicted Fe2+/Mn2+ transporter
MTRPGRRRVQVEHHHRDIQGGAARAAVFGISDGLVSNASLILGLAGASPPASVIRLAGVAGLLGGAFSMAAGEYISMKAQKELFEHEIEVERREIERAPAAESRELAHLYETRGIPSTLAKQLADQVMADPKLALETHTREELGINPGSLGRPMAAAVSSFLTFSVGALVPLFPFLVGGGTSAELATVGLTAVVALVVGGLLSLFTGRGWARSALRQLLICAAAGAVTYGLGTAIGVSGVT